MAQNPMRIELKQKIATIITYFVIIWQSDKTTYQPNSTYSPNNTRNAKIFEYTMGKETCIVHSDYCAHFCSRSNNCLLNVGAMHLLLFSKYHLNTKFLDKNVVLFSSILVYI